MIQSGEIGIIGGMYDIETGKVEFFEPSWDEHLTIEALHCNSLTKKLFRTSY